MQLRHFYDSRFVCRSPQRTQSSSKSNVVVGRVYTVNVHNTPHCFPIQSQGQFRSVQSLQGVQVQNKSVSPIKQLSETKINQMQQTIPPNSLNISLNKIMSSQSEMPTVLKTQQSEELSQFCKIKDYEALRQELEVIKTTTSFYQQESEVWKSRYGETEQELLNLQKMFSELTTQLDHYKELRSSSSLNVHNSELMLLEENEQLRQLKNDNQILPEISYFNSNRMLLRQEGKSTKELCYTNNFVKDSRQFHWNLKSQTCLYNYRKYKIYNFYFVPQNGKLKDENTSLLNIVKRNQYGQSKETNYEEKGSHFNLKEICKQYEDSILKLESQLKILHNNMDAKNRLIDDMVLQQGMNDENYLNQEKNLLNERETLYQKIQDQEKMLQEKDNDISMLVQQIQKANYTEQSQVSDYEQSNGSRQFETIRAQDLKVMQHQVNYYKCLAEEQLSKYNTLQKILIEKEEEIETLKLMIEKFQIEMGQ